MLLKLLMLLMLITEAYCVYETWSQTEGIEQRRFVQIIAGSQREQDDQLLSCFDNDALKTSPRLQTWQHIVLFYKKKKRHP